MIASFPGDFPAWVDAIGWMLLHSLWQGAAVAVALAIALRDLRMAPARSRYLAACLAMCLMIALPATSVRFPEMIPSAVPSSRVIGHDEGTPGILAPSVDQTPATPRTITRLADRLRPLLPTIVGVWMAGVGVCALRLVGGWVQARQWVRRAPRPPAGAWLDRLDRLRERMNLGRAVRLLESGCIEVPMVVGWLRPAILVPVAAFSGLSAAELDAILSHELAHIRRHDYLMNLLQCVVEALMFYHPATWWISRMIRREREHCCDDLAVLACRDRFVYARALAALEGLRAPAPYQVPAANGGILLARVRRILNPQEESMKPVRMLVGLAAALAIAPIWLARADDPTPPIVPARPATTGFPNRSFAEMLTRVDDQPVRKAETAYPARSSAQGRPGGATANRVPILSGDMPRCLDPPSEDEILAKLPEVQRGDSRLHHIQRNHVRIIVEKIGDKVDPVKVYPLAGPCQLVHCHYKCTVSYDELSWSDYPIPFQHVDHKVEVVYIDKDHLRRAQKPDRPARGGDDRLDQISREVEELKLRRRLDREDQDRIINRLIEQLEELKRLPAEDIQDDQAEQTFRKGMYYQRIGKRSSAEFFFKKIVRRWPDSRLAIEARHVLRADVEPADRTAAPYFNYRVGGFY